MAIIERVLACFGWILERDDDENFFGIFFFDTETVIDPYDRICSDTMLKNKIAENKRHCRK